MWERECVCESESERERERDRERDRERESNTHTHAHTHTHTHTRTRIHTQSKSKHTPTKFLRSKESKQDSKVKTRWEQRGNAETLPPPLPRQSQHSNVQEKNDPEAKKALLCFETLGCFADAPLWVLPF